MSKHHFEIEAVSRQDIGKGASRRLRRENNQIPAVVYGDKKPAVSLTLEHDKILHALDQEAFYSSIITLKVDGKDEDVMLKDVQRHVYKPKILHVDFKRITRGVAMKVNVPLHFIGEEDAPGIKEGGVMSHSMNDVEISTLPRNLPEYLEVDASEMEMDQVLHLSDIKLPEGVSIVALTGEEPHDEPVCSIHMPKVVVEEEPEVEAAAEGEEGETEAPAVEGEDTPAAEGESDKPAEGGE